MRRAWVIAMLTVLVLGAAGAQEVVRRLLAHETFVTGPAEWIWDRDRHRQTVPWAFWAVRDFALPEVPASAHLLVRADEAYVVHLNGRRIGSNVDHDGAPVDRYPVAAWLRAGDNRLAVELRSERGAGGLLLALTVEGQEEPRMWTDARWTVFRQDHPGILGGWLPLSQGEPAMSWGRPPMGRWGVPWRAVDRPPFPEAVGEGSAEAGPLPARRVTAGHRTLRALEDGRAGGLEWRPASRLRPRGRIGLPPKTVGERGLGTVVLFDWGREVTGYLTLAHRAGGRQSPGLLRIGHEPPRPRPYGADAVVLTPPGAELWRDALPRRFRYALVLGADSVVGAWIEPVIGGEVGALPWAPDSAGPATGAAPGVFGVEGPTLVTPVEHEVRRKLQRLASGARGEEL